MYRKRGRDVRWPASLRKQGRSGVTSAVGGTVHRWDYMTVCHSVCKSASLEDWDSCGESSLSRSSKNK